jgi:hypothetical protein
MAVWLFAMAFGSLAISFLRPALFIQNPFEGESSVSQLHVPYSDFLSHVP